MSALQRDFVADLEIRSGGDGRTVHGIIVPFGQVARVSDGGAPYDEKFQSGSFTKTLQERKAPVYLLSQHKSDAPLGRATDIREEALGVYGAFRVSKTNSGDEHLELVRDGVLGSFSVGFRPVAQKREGNVTVRTEVALREVSLVTFPAYDGALVSGVRSAEQAEFVQTLMGALAAADTVDPFVAAVVAADAVEATRAALAQILTEPDEGNPMTSFATRLDAALDVKASGTPEGAASEAPSDAHAGRLIIARNNLRAALIERGIRP